MRAVFTIVQLMTSSLFKRQPRGLPNRGCEEELTREMYILKVNYFKKESSSESMHACMHTLHIISIIFHAMQPSINNIHYPMLYILYIASNKSCFLFCIDVHYNCNINIKMRPFLEEVRHAGIHKLNPPCTDQSKK